MVTIHQQGATLFSPKIFNCISQWEIWSASSHILVMTYLSWWITFSSTIWSSLCKSCLCYSVYKWRCVSVAILMLLGDLAVSIWWCNVYLSILPIVTVLTKKSQTMTEKILNSMLKFSKGINQKVVCPNIHTQWSPCIFESNSCSMKWDNKANWAPAFDKSIGICQINDPNIFLFYPKWMQKPARRRACSNNF